MNVSSNKPRMIAVLIGVFSFLIAACSPTKILSPAAAIDMENFDQLLVFDHSHKKFDLLLKKYVINGWVDYQGILSEPDIFYEYLNSLAEVKSDSLDKWTREQKLAFWINAYNAFTIQAVIERYPITSRSLIGLFSPKNSILQISGVWSRLKFDAGGQRLTLWKIEHGIIRKMFDEARIHFAIVCASRSCPALRPEAYQADILERQLEEQALQFINDPDRGVRWDPAKRRLYLSKIFKWFKADFKKKVSPNDVPAQSQITENPLLTFIRPYITSQQVKDALADGRDIRVKYLHYDWHLNDLAENQSKSLEDSGERWITIIEHADSV